eukprot:COSAG05_NODE_1713_length_4230_cov_3.216897_7_plen_32_part_00
MQLWESKSIYDEKEILCRLPTQLMMPIVEEK